MMKRENTLAGLRAVCVIWLILSLLPLLHIAVFDHSGSDDFSYGYATHAVWEETGDFWKVLEKAWEQVETIYKGWQGSFTAVFLFALQPAVFGEEYYILTPFLMLGAYLYGMFRLCRSIAGPEGKALADMAACLLLFLTIQTAPSPVDAFYWFNGASYYVLWHSLLLAQTARELRWLRDGRSRGLSPLLGALTGALLGGTNYITALLAVELAAVVMLLSLWKRPNVFVPAFLALACTSISLTVSAMAPGNSVRQDTLAPLDAWDAILASFPCAWEYAAGWCTPFFVVTMLALLPVMLGLAKQADWLDSRPALALCMGIAVGLYVSTFTPTLFAGDRVGMSRVQNVRFFVFTGLVAFLEFALLRLLLLTPLEKPLSRLREWNRRHATLCVCLSALLAAEGAALCELRGGGLAGVSAARSLQNGEAAVYSHEMEDRLKILEHGEGDLLLPPLRNHPSVLFAADVTIYTNYWRNVAVARYFDLDSVTLGEEPGGRLR